MLNVTAIVPSLNPDEKLYRVASGLVEVGFTDILLIDDGSDDEHRGRFDECAVLPGVTVLHHEVNRGKGAALRTAFAYVLENRPESAGVVTLDGDAQHRPADVMNCSLEMLKTPDSVILGVRDFSGPDVPVRSRKGNHLTSWVFKTFCHLKISDTQTGLRAIPASLLPTMLDITGDRYEYETNMLLRLGEDKIPYREVQIETVYIEENQTSHFRPVRDSVRIYSLIFGRFVKYALSSIGCMIVEGILQTILHTFWESPFKDTVGGFFGAFLKELCDFLPARILSSILNYYINKKFVFNGKKQAKGSLVRYYILWAAQAVVTALCTTAVVTLVGGADGFAYFCLTTLVKCVIFFASYKIQKVWVFAPAKENSKKA